MSILSQARNAEFGAFLDSHKCGAPARGNARNPARRHKVFSHE
jgi:hypothetical protein